MKKLFTILSLLITISLSGQWVNKNYPWSFPGVEVRDSLIVDGSLDVYKTLGATEYRLYFDTTLGKVIVCNGSAWVNMDGTAS